MSPFIIAIFIVIILFGKRFCQTSAAPVLGLRSHHDGAGGADKSAGRTAGELG
jgi:hypothetical protein